MSLARLVYVSTARSGLRAGELETLLAAARARNEGLSLTGLLIYNGLNFMQALEGPREAVDTVFASIRTDPRHHGIVSLYEEQTSVRAFPGWSMAFGVVAGQSAAPDAFRVPADRIGELIPDSAGPELAMLFTSFNTMDRLTNG